MRFQHSARLWYSVARFTLVFYVAGTASLYAQYRSPGSPVVSSDIPSEESFENSIGRSPWRIGRFSFLPWIGIRDASFVRFDVDSQGDSSNDFTMTVGAGIRTYSRIGSKLILTAHALPEYVFWDESEEKSRLNGRYGAGIFGYYNRLRFEVSQQQNQRQAYFSSEIQELTTVSAITTTAQTEIEVGHRIAILAGGSKTELDAKEDDTPLFSTLDRDNERVFVGLILTTSRDLEISVVQNDMSIDFSESSRNLSSTGTETTVSLSYQKSDHLTFDLGWSFNDLKPQAGSEFQSFDETTSDASIGWSPMARFDVNLYSRKSLGFSVDETYSHFVNERRGISLSLSFKGGSISFGGETGKDIYHVSESSASNRIDDVDAYFAELKFEFRQGVDLRLAATSTDYASETEAFNRSVDDFTFSIGLTALSDLLGIGQGSQEW